MIALLSKCCTSAIGLSLFLVLSAAMGSHWNFVVNSPLGSHWN